MKIEDIVTAKGISFGMIIVAPLIIVLSVTMFLANLLVALFVLGIGGILIFLMGLIINKVIKQKEKMKFKHEDWDKDCNEKEHTLSLVFNRKYYYVCSSCGYDSRGKEFCKKKRSELGYKEVYNRNKSLPQNLCNK